MSVLKKVILIILTAAVFGACSKGEKRIVAKYDNGNPYIACFYKKQGGKEIRTYQEHYYPDGKIRAKGKCEGEKRKGVWKFYYQDGSEFARVDFSERKEGTSWQVRYDKDSLLVKKTDVLTSVAFSNEGTPVSLRIEKDGQEIFYRFFNSFKLMERITIKGNVPQGEALSWYENGNINSVHYYVDGLQDSLYTVYSESGQKLLSGKYSKGVKVGKWEYFSSEGKPLGVEYYDSDGTILKERERPGLTYYYSEK
ncbi:MAG: hypothetical protein IJ250_06310 [Bacteroidales bacterium]|nr:hypothetical protein [Bacteroidales bacterium]